MGVSQNQGVPFLGVPIIRTIIFLGLYWGRLILGNYHMHYIRITFPIHTKTFGEPQHLRQVQVQPARVSARTSGGHAPARNPDK